jgi:hypothetical protein
MRRIIMKKIVIVIAVLVALVPSTVFAGITKTQERNFGIIAIGTIGSIGMGIIRSTDVDSLRRISPALLCVYKTSYLVRMLELCEEMKRQYRGDKMYEVASFMISTALKSRGV